MLGKEYIPESREKVYKGQTQRNVGVGKSWKGVFAHISILIMKMTIRVEETRDLTE